MAIYVGFKAYFHPFLQLALRARMVLENE